MSTIDYDKYGHCIMCHIDMNEERVADGQVIKMLSPKYIEKEYLLNDGSRMRVAMCNKCYSHLKDNEDEYDIVMGNVYRGWEHETNLYVKKRFKGKTGIWNKEKQKQYLKKMKKYKIVTKTDGIRQGDLNKLVKEFNKPKKDK